MMKNVIILFTCLILSACFWACDKDDNEEKGPQLAFSKLIYTLDAENPLEVEIQVSEPVQANTSVKFNVRGALFREKNMNFRLMSLSFRRGKVRHE